MTIADVKGVGIHYLQVGKGPELLLIHGLGGNLAVWFLHVVSRLRSDFRLTALDLRGHGRSDAPPTGYTTADMAEDVKGLLDVTGIEKTSIFGHSWGADVAMHFALLYPERVDKVFAIEPNIAALIDWRKSKNWEGWAYWAKRLEEFGIHVPRDKWHDIDYMLRQTVHIPIVYGPCKGRPRQNNSILRLLDKTTIVKDYEKVAGMTIDKVKKIKRPTLALYGQKSHFLVTYKYLRDHVPRVKTALLPDDDHYGPLENPEMALGYLREFL
ncbi:alpha/beta hydrolase [Desulfobacula sp.]|uniref:alpha/beta fold hydrolase n=1 Tax=Desulfobacula sp. TaxID=2593537 RepID=UPI00262EAE49|nr:alpha/beta hydrolase [Desulfobacula sp.]